MYQPLPLQDLPKFTQNRILGLKIEHLATLFTYDNAATYENEKFMSENVGLLTSLKRAKGKGRGRPPPPPPPGVRDSLNIKTQLRLLLCTERKENGEGEICLFC
jgi:hypothetical protein